MIIDIHKYFIYKNHIKSIFGTNWSSKTYEHAFMLAAIIQSKIS